MEYMKRFLFILIFCLFFLMNNSTALRCSALGAIDINTASVTQLEEIISVGPVIAQRIIDGRPFSSLDDLLRVSGIGPKTLQKIKEQGLACVNCASAQLNPEARNPKSETNSSSLNSEIQNTTSEKNALPAAVSNAEVLQNAQKSDISNKVEGSPWFLFFTTLIATLALAGIVLFIKFRIYASK